MAAHRGPRMPAEPFIGVSPAEGAWAAAQRLGIDLSPAPDPSEHARRQQLKAELERELATPLIERKIRD